MPEVKRLIVLGGGGNSLDIIETVREINLSAARPLYELEGILDDDPSLRDTEVLGVKVVGPLDRAADFKGCWFVNGIGSPNNFWKRSEIVAKTGVPLDHFETLIHPTAFVSKTAHLGNGTVVLQSVTIGPRAVISDQVIVLANAVLSHDDVVGAYSCIAGSVCVSGGVRVGRSCYLGANCSIIGGVEVGDYSLIGIGSVVLKDVPPETVVVGNPAYVLRRSRP